MYFRFIKFEIVIEWLKASDHEINFLMNSIVHIVAPLLSTSTLLWLWNFHISDPFMEVFLINS